MLLPTEIVFISSDERRKLLGDDRGVVIPDIVDFTRFDRNLDGQRCRHELGLSPNDQVVLFLGGLSDIKGAHPFLEALPIVREQHPRLHVVVAAGISPMSHRLDARIGRLILPLLGQPTDRQRAGRILRRHDMGSYLHLLAFRRDAENLMAASDVVVFPSTEPHNGRPVQEAGAMAKPVVASRIGGVEELVEDGETGILVPPGDVQALADALGKVLGDHTGARRMGERGFLRAKRLYNADFNSQQTFAIYDRILSR
jgi:glycosyltransferase involved in cell wall biosynthesis